MGTIATHPSACSVLEVELGICPIRSHKITPVRARTDDLGRNFVIIEHQGDGVVGYGRTGSDDTPEGHVHYWVAPIYGNHLA